MARQRVDQISWLIGTEMVVRSIQRRTGNQLMTLLNKIGFTSMRRRSSSDAL